MGAKEVVKGKVSEKSQRTRATECSSNFGRHQWRGGRGARGAMAPLNGAQMEIRGRQNCLLVIYLARIIKIDRTLVEHFAVTCCEQSYKTCESTFVSYVFVLTMYVASCLARQLTVSIFHLKAQYFVHFSKLK